MAEKLKKTRTDENVNAIRADIAIFEGTEGWARLSPLQQKLIRMSLIVSERAKRGDTEAASLEQDSVIALLSKDFREGSLEYNEYAHKLQQRIREVVKHLPSKEYVDNFYCNLAVYVLEDIDILVPEKKNIRDTLSLVTREAPPGRFFQGVPYDFRDVAQLKAALGDEFPYVCHAGASEQSSFHSILVLGRDGDDFVVWHKAGRREPYERTMLSECLTDYPPEKIQWSVRPLSRRSI